MGYNTSDTFKSFVYQKRKFIERMATDYTLQQTAGEQMRAEELSLRATVPPAQIPGYRIDSLLGQGAFGQVWVGSDLNTGRPVAVKFYLHRSGVNWALLAREVKNLVTMSANRFIVQVLDVGWDSEPPYYVMEYLENGSLDELIRQRGAMGVAKAIEIFTDVAIGLNHSHGKGVLHCDLKPANVLLDQDMRPRLADFGQSRMSTEQTPSLGTLFYMAPEQADLNALPDARWDVYALGAILYTMLVGTPPHRTPQSVTSLDTASSLPERLSRYRDTIAKASPPRAHHRVPGMDRALAGIVDRCIAKNPADRYGNVQQVIGALERRQASRLRRPLLMLGIFAPLILLSAMALFGWRGISIAAREATEEIRQITMLRNMETANFAASALESELDRLFRTLESEAEKPEFRRCFVEFKEAAGPDLLSSLAVEEPPPESLSKLLALDQQGALQEYLHDRFQKILNESAKTSSDEPRYSSLFVTDHFGNMVASAFSDTQETNKVGWNFAWRSYFSGQRQDSLETVPRRNIGPTTFSHVSVPFKSTTTQRWKIAVCTPITFERDDASDTLSVEGVLVLTINLGNVELISSSEAKKNQENSDSSREKKEEILAVLVDGHDGPREGTILQHPMLQALSKKLGSDTDLAKLTFQLDKEQMRKLREEGSFSYIDPVSKRPPNLAPDEEWIGKSYEGEWIATMRQVDISHLSLSEAMVRRKPTDLFILVQERADAAVEPVSGLVQKLVREGWFAFLSIVSLISALWYFVFRVLRIPEQNSVGARLRTGGSSSLGSATNDATIDITS